MLADRFSKAVTFVALAIGAVAMLMPLAWMISTSLKTITEVVIDPPPLLPASPQWANYHVVLTQVDFLKYMGNSLIVALLNVAGTLVTSAPAAYAFARLPVRGSQALFLLLLSALMLPPQVTIIPQFWLYIQLGWINTPYPLFMPAWLGTNIFATFLLRQFFLQVPEALREAARLDGAGELSIILRIFFPLSRPALVTVAVLTFMGSWNDLWTPLIFIHNESLFTLPVALVSFLALQGQASGTQWHLMMAAATISVIPIIVLFMFAQRQFVEGIASSGVKE